MLTREEDFGYFDGWGGHIDAGTVMGPGGTGC